jgi:hypothetical protein
MFAKAIEYCYLSIYVKKINLKYFGSYRRILCAGWLWYYGKKQQAWYKVRNSEFSFQQAVSNCEDQLRKSSTDDSRFIAQIAGIQHPVFLICMMRNGFELRDL